VTRRSLAVVVAALGLLIAPGAAHAATVTCGQTITTDTKLDGDVADCPGDGIVIGAPNITLDLNGHVVDRRGPTDFGAGIRNPGYDGVTIKNGHVQQFSVGLRVEGASGITVSGLDVHAGDTAVFLVGVENSRVENSGLTAAILGVYLGAGSRGNRIVRNSIFESHVAIYSAGTQEGDRAGGNRIFRNSTSSYADPGILLDTGTDDTAVEGNTVSYAEGNGIEVREPGPTPNRVGANTTTRNGKSGIAAVAPVIDLGGNQSRDNFGSAQCVGVRCDASSITFFGKPYSGDSFSAMSAQSKRASAFVFLISGTVTKLTAFIDGKGAATGSQVMRAVIYANNSGGGPGALVARSFQGTVNAGAPGRWVSFYFPYPPRLQQGVYWLGIHSGPGNGVARFAWDSAPGSGYFNVDAYADGAAYPFGPASVDNRQMSIFAAGVY
jgi:hypothetical protein